MFLPLSPETGNMYVQTHIYVCLVCAKNKAFERENKHISIFNCNLCWSKFQILPALGTVIGI